MKLADGHQNERIKGTNDPYRRLIEHVRTLYRKDHLSGFSPLGTVESLALPGEDYKLAFTPRLLAQIYKRKLGSAPEENLLPDLTLVLGGIGSDQGGYQSSQILRSQELFPADSTDPRWTLSDADDHWWIPSGRVFYSPTTNDSAASELALARDHFFLPHRFRDPFNHETTVAYDSDPNDPTRNHNLLLVETRDALDNVVTVKTQDDEGHVEIRNDYRVLQPDWVTDPNGNRTRVAFDALGLVVATAAMGKPPTNDRPAEGDELDTFTDDDTNPTLVTLQNFVQDPGGQAQGSLKNATTRIIYDLDRFTRCGQPPFAATLARETHTSDLSKEQQSKIQISFLYSDGFDREVQTKVQAEPGDAPQREPEILPAQRGDPPQDTGDICPGPLVLDANGKPVPAHTDHRWVGTGRTVYNNKGKPIKKYEPFFSSTHLYEPESEMTDTGVTPILFYDPVERVVATLHPNHTYEKVVFDPWQQATYDVNDTVTLDPKTDPNVGSFFTRLPQADFIPTWYQQRMSDTAVAEDKVAANKAAKHADSPTVAHFDTLGRTFLTCAHNRFERDGAVIDDIYPIRVEIDIEGNQREVRDEWTNAQGVREQRIVMRYDYDMLSNRIHQASMEAGERWTLNDVMGKPIRAWDSRGFARRMTYDALRRPLHLYVRSAGGLEQLAERTVYGETHPDSQSPATATPPPCNLNLRTKALMQFDEAGVAVNMGRDRQTNKNEAYDFKGNLLRSTRRLAREYRQLVDWSSVEPQLGAETLDPQGIESMLEQLVEPDSYPGSTMYDALNRPTAITTPDNSVYRPTFNEANLLDKVDVYLRGAETATPFVTNIDYNAKGQRERIDYGNGASTRYEYDPLTFRLIHLLTIRGRQDASDCAPSLNPRTCQDPPAICNLLSSNKCILQNLHYTYDPTGNITHIRDDAQQTIYFRNKRVEPSADYTYDAIYRLIEASGREHLGQLGGTPVPTSPTDAPRVGLEHPGDGQAMGLYREIYTYDEAGNFKKLRHVGTDPAHPGWTRPYQYQEPSLIEPDKSSNRLTSTAIGNETERYTYNEHGDMTSMPHLLSMIWDFKDQLQQVELGGGGTAYYVYDASGQRVRKVIESHNGTGWKERIYIGGLEIYREYNGNGSTKTLERETLHITDDKQRIALVETRTQGNDPAPQQLIRYQSGNHLGSASLELDEQAQITSHEEYTPYGTTSYQAVRSRTETPKRYRYTGKERDEESGLYYHGARYCAPWLGRWVSADPRGILDGIDLYLYVNNNPVMNVDPSGTQCDPTIASCLDPSWPTSRELMEEKCLPEEHSPVTSSGTSSSPAAPPAEPTVQQQQTPWYQKVGFYYRTSSGSPYQPIGYVNTGKGPVADFAMASILTMSNIASTPLNLWFEEIDLLTSAMRAVGFSEYELQALGTMPGFAPVRAVGALGSKTAAASRLARVAARARPAARVRAPVPLPPLGASSETANVFQHAVHGGAGERGVGVFYVKDVSRLSAAELESVTAAMRDADFQAGMQGGLVRQAGTARKIEDAVARWAKRMLGLGTKQAAGHTPDAAAGGSPLGPIMGIPRSVNSSWGGQLKRYQPGFVFEGFSLFDRATRNWLYISQSLELEPPLITTW